MSTASASATSPSVGSGSNGAAVPTGAGFTTSAALSDKAIAKGVIVLGMMLPLTFYLGNLWDNPWAWRRHAGNGKIFLNTSSMNWLKWPYFIGVVVVQLSALLQLSNYLCPTPMLHLFRWRDRRKGLCTSPINIQRQTETDGTEHCYGCLVCTTALFMILSSYIRG